MPPPEVTASGCALCPGYVRPPMTARNGFPMPLLMEAGDTARRALAGIERNQVRVAYSAAALPRGPAGGGTAAALAQRSSDEGASVELAGLIVRRPCERRATMFSPSTSAAKAMAT